MITIYDKKDCSGCAACADICAHACITMKPDAEGFVYPETDQNRCVGCGLCDRVCPIINVPEDNHIGNVIAAKNSNPAERLQSSSGGIFALIASHFIRQGGMIVGCKLDSKMKAIHTVAQTEAELRGMLSSKYVQSDTSGIYRQVRELLHNGKKVLFAGVPCQVAALRNFLLKPHDNLATIDILCHGVPSPKFFQEFLDSLEKRYGAQVTGVSFRCKDKSWKRLYIDVKFSNGKRHFLYAGYDSYMQLFLSDTLQRKSCFECPYNTLQRPGDISLGDFWGIGKYDYNFDDNKGVSLLLTNNEKGRLLWESVAGEAVSRNASLEMAIAGNKVLVQHLPSSSRRDAFYKKYVAEGYEAAVAAFAPEASKTNQLYYNFMRSGLDLIRKIKRESY